MVPKVVCLVARTLQTNVISDVFRGRGKGRSQALVGTPFPCVREWSGGMREVEGGGGYGGGRLRGGMGEVG